jgi:hypothetical protein
VSATRELFNDPLYGRRNRIVAVVLALLVAGAVVITPVVVAWLMPSDRSGNLALGAIAGLSVTLQLLGLLFVWQLIRRKP